MADIAVLIKRIWPETEKDLIEAYADFPDATYPEVRDAAIEWAIQHVYQRATTLPTRAEIEVMVDERPAYHIAETAVLYRLLYLAREVYSKNTVSSVSEGNLSSGSATKTYFDPARFLNDLEEQLKMSLGMRQPWMNDQIVPPVTVRAPSQFLVANVTRPVLPDRRY